MSFFAQAVASASRASHGTTGSGGNGGGGRKSAAGAGSASSVAPSRSLLGGAAFVTTWSGGQRGATVRVRTPARPAPPPASAPAAAAAAASQSPADADDFLDEASLPSTAHAAASMPSSAAPVTPVASRAAVTDLTDSPVKAKSAPADRAPRRSPPLVLQPPQSAAAASSSAPTLQCMLCGTSLAMLPLDERQRHINRCLDQLSQPMTAVATPAAAARAASTPISAARNSPAPPAAPPTPAPKPAVFVTPLKRKHDSNSAATPLQPRTKSAASATPPAAKRTQRTPEVCVIDDDDDVDMGSTVPASASAAAGASTFASPAAASASPSTVSAGGVRRSITDFFNTRNGGRAAPPATATSLSTAAVRHASPSPPALSRAPTLPLPSASDDGSSASAAFDDSSFAAATSAVLAEADVAAAVAASAAAAAAALTVEKTKDTWKFLLTGRKTGTLTPAPSFGSKGSKAGLKGGGKQGGGAGANENGASAGGGRFGAGATIGADRSGRGGLPSHKRLPGTSILTDAFMYTRAIQSLPWPADNPPLFFLSHFHADHYAGLSGKWCAGRIFCSEITARLVRNAFGPGPDVVVLPLHERIEIGGVRVTLVDAHHCPGAVVFVYETPPFAPAVGVNYSFLSPQLQAQRREEEARLVAQHGAELSDSDPVAATDPAASARARRAGLAHGRVYVHGGDMRYHQAMRELFLPDEAPVPAPTWSREMSAAPSPFLPRGYVPCSYPSAAFKNSLAHLQQLSVHTVYLDTTYCNPRYRFPPQSVSVAHTLAVVGECLAREAKAGVSSLVERNGASAAKSKLDFFKPYVPPNQHKSAPAETAAAAVDAPAAAAAPFQPPSIDGVASFLTQLPSDEVAAAAVGMMDAFSAAQAASDPSGAADSSSTLDLEGGSEELEGEDQRACDADACAGADGRAGEENLGDHGEGEEEDEEDGDEELEDLMMRDYDRPDEEEGEGAPCDEEASAGEEPASASSVVAAAAAASGSAVTGALSSIWSSVSSSVSVLRSNLALGSSFLAGYKRQSLSRTLFLVGSYSIGKEKIFIEIARQFGLKIFVPAYRMRTIKMLDLFDEAPPLAEPASTAEGAPAASSSSSAHSSPSKVSTHFPAPAAPASASIHREWRRWSAEEVLTTSISGARLHVIPLSHVSHKSIGMHLDPALNQHMPGEVVAQFHRVVAFRPTGWVGNKPTHTERNHTVTLPAPTKLVPHNSPEALAAGAAVSAVAPSAGGKKSGGSRGKTVKIPMVRVPTGPARKHTLSVSIHGVPYSEHSTFPELEQFVHTLSACGLRDIIPTVNVATCRDTVRKSWGHLLNSEPGPAAASSASAATSAQPIPSTSDLEAGPPRPPSL